MIFECLLAGNERQNQSTRPESFIAESYESRSKSRRQVWQVVLFLMRCCSLKLLLMRGRASIFEQTEDVLEIFFVEGKIKKTCFAALCRDFTHYIEFVNLKVHTVIVTDIIFYTFECEFNMEKHIYKKQNKTILRLFKS